MTMRLLCASLSLVLLCSFAAEAQPLPSYFKANNNAGTDFWLTFLPAWPMAGGKNNIKIYVTSPVETEVVVEVKSEGWIKVQKTKPNDIIEFILPVTIAQPYYKTDRDPTPAEKVYRQHGVHVYSKDPITVCGVTRYQHTGDAFMALPTSALGTEYIVASYSDVGDNGTSSGQYLPSLTAIVAPYDNTKVIFTLGGNQVTKTAGGMKPGESKSWALNKGDVLPIGSLGKSADLSGSIISASRPVSVISGNFCAFVPEDKPTCDHLLEMELPTHTWGQEYVVTRIFTRKNNSIIKVMAKEPNTKVFLDGRHVYTIQTPGGVEGTGYMFRRVAEGAPKSYVVTADKPISVTQYNPGQADDSVSSDPFQMVLTPVEQYTNEFTFCTPGIGSGTGFGRNYVNVVFELDEKKDMPMDLEWAIVENGEFEWKSLGERYGFFFESIEINGKAYGVKVIQLPRDGVYRVRAKGRCGAAIYGFSDSDSYGMPAGAYLVDREVTDSIAPEPVYTVNCDGSVPEGRVVDSGESYLAKVSMIYAESFNYDFSVEPFVAGKDAGTEWTLSVVDKTKPAKAVLLFVDRAGNTVIDSVVYAVPTLSTALQQVDFGRVRAATGKSVTVGIHNTGTIPVTVDSVYMKDNTVFSILATPALPFVVAPGDSVGVDVLYSPAAAANPEAQHSAVLMARTECAELTVGIVAGRGVVPVIAATDRNIGTVPVGQELCISIEVSNPGGDTLVITGLTGIAPPFYIKDLEPAFPVHIAPNESVIFRSFCFAPTEEGQFTTALTFSSNAWPSVSDSVCVLQGTALTPTDVPFENGNTTAFTCFPNPATEHLQINYMLPAAGSVRIEIYTIAGGTTHRLYEGWQEAGPRVLNIPVDVAAGVYLCRLVTPSGTATGKITIVD